MQTTTLIRPFFHNTAHYFYLLFDVKGFCTRPLFPSFQGSCLGRSYLKSAPSENCSDERKSRDIKALLGGRGRWVGYAGTLSAAVFNFSSCDLTPLDSMIELNGSFLRLGRLSGGRGQYDVYWGWESSGGLFRRRPKYELENNPSH